MMSAMDGVTLPPDLEQFAADAVAAGRYRDVGEVLAVGVGLLRRVEAQRDELRASVMAAEAQGERDGFLSIDDVMRDADALLKEMAGPQR
jgi:putative addiction module CopG family antidote